MPVYTRAHVLRDADVDVEGTNYEDQIAKVRAVPDTPIQSMPVLSPTGTLQDKGNAVWTLELSGVQDFGTGSIGKVIRDAAAAGTTLTMTFQPKKGTGQDVMTCEFIAVDIEFGGETGEFRTFDAEFPIVGQPVITQSV